jgi:hypothetical protein
MDWTGEDDEAILSIDTGVFGNLRLLGVEISRRCSGIGAEAALWMFVWDNNDRVMGLRGIGGASSNSSAANAAIAV